MNDSLRNGTSTESPLKLIEDSRVQGVEYQNPEVIILDMDGTIYDLASFNGEPGFMGSTLRQKVLQNAIAFVETLSPSIDASAFIEKAEDDEVGISAYIEKMFGVPREAYFDYVWDINPEDVIEPGNTIFTSLARLATLSSAPEIVLLTAAPKKWMLQVVDYFGLGKILDRKIPGDEFDTKDDAFISLACEYNPKTTLSIGDQYQTDVLPALRLGFMAIQVEDADDTAKILGELCLEN